MSLQRCARLLLCILPAFASNWAWAAEPGRAGAETEIGRAVTDLSEGWRFHYGALGDSPSLPGFDDRGWEKVSVPHTWNRLGEYALQRSAGTNARQGVGWYRLSFKAPPVSKERRRQYLDFGAVGAIADVWVNGVHVGQHKGAFSRFRFDVTSQWKPGALNVVAVRADNSKPAVGSTTEDVLPLSGDFFVYGGIYRGVSLISADDLGIDLLDYGGPGIYANVTNVSAEKADVAVLARLRNNGRAARSVKIVTTIRDGGGVPVAQTAKTQRLQPGAGEAVAKVALASPRLWSGRADPYLYTVRVEITEGGRMIDSVTQPLGIRFFRFDADEGFFLNGRHLKLYGVSRHQDREGKGWALAPEDHAQDMALIAEMGANTVRQAHYQHADEWSDEADRAGMVVWAEVPYVTTPSLRGGQGAPALWANAEQQLRELIRQNYNHPAILMWSIGNEVDSAKGFGIAGDPPKPLALLQHLQQVAKQEDPSRPTTFADCCEDLATMKTAGEKLAGTADLIGYNRYYGWYFPDPLQARKQLGEQLDRFHARHPQLPIALSEYGAGGSISQHSDNIAAGYLNFTGRPQPEEFESFVHEQNWPAIRERKYLFASWVWNMFDFASDLRGEGDSVDINTKGLVAFDRRVKKDVFYYYQTQWTDTPMIHLTEKRYRSRAYPLMEVKAYSNAPRATLSFNGKPLGEAPCIEGICRWPGVALRSGENEAVVTARSGGDTVSDRAIWIGPDPARGLFVEAGDLAGHVAGGERFGSDNFVTGGMPMALNRGGFGGRRERPPRTVVAPLPELYSYWRQGDAFSYALPVPNGKWTVAVHTFEPDADAPASATMAVLANGRMAVTPFNVKDAAGGALKGVAISFPVTVGNGGLQLDFRGARGKAIVAAIEVRP